MVRHIPATCTNDILLEEWPADGSWDFLYLPLGSGGKSTLGYAFINFVSEMHAAAFYSSWQGRRLLRFDKGRRLNITAADVQGLEANVRQLKKKPANRLRSRQCRPIIIKNGREVSMHEL